MLRFMLDLERRGETVSLLKNEWLGGEKTMQIAVELSAEHT